MDPIAAVQAERERQRAKWGNDHDPGDGVLLAVLMEEVGEVARELCDQWPAKAKGQNLETELIQVAAVACQWIETLQRRRSHGSGGE